MPLNDSLPATLPRGFQEPEPFNGSSRPSWALFAPRPPSAWPLDRNSIQTISTFLGTIHPDEKHRANASIQDLDLLQRNHHLVYCMAAKHWYRSHPGDVEMVPDTMPCDLTEEKRVQSAVIQNDTCALSFFASRRAELSSQGFCVREIPR